MSTKAYSQNDTRKQIVLAILRQIGRAATAEQVIETYDRDNQDQSVTERVRFGKEVHGTLSTLFNDGKIRRAGTVLNPASGAEVYSYEVEQIQRAPREKVSKGYKEKCDALEKQLKEENERNEFLVMRNQRLIGEVEGLKAQLAARR